MEAHLTWPLPNCWLGVSAEDQQRWDERVPELLNTPAAMRFVSAEPLLGAIETTYEMIDWVIVGGESGAGARPCDIGWIRGIVEQCQAAGTAVFVKQLGSKPVALADGSVLHSSKDAELVAIALPEFHVRLRDRKGGDGDEWPEDLRVREFPIHDSRLPNGGR